LDGIAEDANGELYYLFENGQVIKLLPKFIPGDYYRDGIVNSLDYEAWRTTFGQTGPNLAADGNGNGVVDGADYVVWRKYLGTSVLTGAGSGAVSAVPEPAAAWYAIQLVTIAWLIARALPAGAGRCATLNSPIATPATRLIHNRPLDAHAPITWAHGAR
jgi:hypothetical protein